MLNKDTWSWRATITSVMLDGWELIGPGGIGKEDVELLELYIKGLKCALKHGLDTEQSEECRLMLRRLTDFRSLVKKCQA